MDDNAQKELFSFSYIDAVASQAGYQRVQPHVDHDSVDGILLADFGRRPRIEFQAKSTELDIVQGNNLHFPLPVKNYNDLRADTRTPRILIVVLVPKEKEQWVNQTEDELCLRRCAYWTCLEGSTDRPNTSSVTVYVPTANVFSSDQLTDLMQKAERGDPLC